MILDHNSLLFICMIFLASEAFSEIPEKEKLIPTPYFAVTGTMGNALFSE